MTPGRRRRRALVLLSLALACGGLAASHVQSRERQVEAAVGPLVPVLVTRTDIESGERLKARQLAVRQVPSRFAPRDALPAASGVAGQRSALPLPAGSYVTAGALESAGRDGNGGGPAPIRRGERSTDVAVAGGDGLSGAPPGTRVDVLVTTEARGGGGGAGRTYVALQDVELLGARPAPEGAAAAGGGGDAGSKATTIATLRVSLREAVFLTAAENFAREIRLLVRAPGDRAPARQLSVSSALP
jgi:pilus assembly protein CpaB